MRYAKYKREKISVCNLCREEKPLSWDHVPPKGGIELSSVQMQTILDLMAGDIEQPQLRESQNGVKYRTLCKECNELLGVQYDPTLNNFAIEVGRYLNTSLALPSVIHHPVMPQRLLKALLGHLIAAKVDIEDTAFDQLAREYVLDEAATLPDDINVFYWPYPHECSVAIRDFGMFTPRGTLNEPAIFQTLKYFPIAYLCCNKPEYANLDSLSRYRSVGLNDMVELPKTLSRIEHAYWPEETNDTDNKVFFGGQSSANAIHATPRKRV